MKSARRTAGQWTWTWLTSARAQEVIEDYTINGETLLTFNA
jgi:ABC-type tungstate transport system permease subunit